VPLLPCNENKRRKSLQINKTLETPEGKVVFEGTLEEKELDLVIEIGLNMLLQTGAFNLKVKTDDTAH
jgi:hypothetical protein